MKKKSTSQSAPASRSFVKGGFFNLRLLIGLVVVLSGVLLALLGFGMFSNASAQPNAGSTNSPEQADETIGEQIGQMMVIPAVHSDLSPPLREQPVQSPQGGRERERHTNPKLPIRHHDRPDPVIQSSFSQQPTSLAIPAPVRQWAGLAGNCEFVDGNVSPTCGVPPDTNGAVGKTQYVQMVNDALQVFDKRTGTSLLGPISIASIWGGFGGPCYTRGQGDPIVVYDRLADRWVISQFAVPVGSNPEPQNECIAVSETGDATGSWYRYDFHLSFRMPDYPKFGVWPDGYYMSAIMFRTDPAMALGVKAFVFDRAKMLVGDPTATVQAPKDFVTQDFLDFFLPSDLDGMIPPPAGAPNFFVGVTIATEEKEGPRQEEVQQNTPPPRAASTPPPRYKVWAFHVDWNDPDNSTFTLRANVPAADFTVLCPNTRECVPQKGVPDPLDAVADRVMFRNAYRRFPNGRESMLNNFTVSANSVAGIRWFELQRMHPSGWTLRQQSTYAPLDSTWRWMGSIASDNQGNIALGFSASSETIHPQIRYAGRLATDPLNNLSGEQHLFDGTGSQVDRPCDPDKDPDCVPEPPQYRWGDYSDMTVDPEDDCTFYYTNEYYKKTSEFYWKTRIGYFKFAQCTEPQKGTGHFVITACNGGAPVHNASVSIDGRPYGATLADGTYDAVLRPGSHTYAVSNPAFGTQTGSFTIVNGQSTPVEICL